MLYTAYFTPHTHYFTRWSSRWFKNHYGSCSHENSKTAYNIYTHVSEKMKKDAQEKMVNKFGDLMELSISKSGMW